MRDRPNVTRKRYSERANRCREVFDRRGRVDTPPTAARAPAEPVQCSFDEVSHFRSPEVERRAASAEKEPAWCELGSWAVVGARSEHCLRRTVRPPVDASRQSVRELGLSTTAGGCRASSPSLIMVRVARAPGRAPGLAYTVAISSLAAPARRARTRLGTQALLGGNRGSQGKSVIGRGAMTTELRSAANRPCGLAP